MRLFIFTLLVFFTSHFMHAQIGSHDLNFGYLGKNFSKVDTFSESVICSKINAIGDIFTIGTYNSQNTSTYDAYYLTKHKSNGFLDSSFANNGIIKDSFTIKALLNDFVLLNDGSIIAGGGSFQSSHPYLIKLKPNGSYDSTFGTNGKMLLTNHSKSLNIVKLKLLNSGKLLAGVVWNDGSINFDIGVAQLQANGKLDSSYGIGGLKILSMPQHFESLENMDIQNDGKIVLIGKQYDSYDKSKGIIVRLLANGNPDNTFGNNGIVEISTLLGQGYNALTDMVIQPNNEILVCGYSIEQVPNSLDYTNHFLLARVQSNGQLDNGFGNNGLLISDIYVGGEIATSIALQEDDKIICGGLAGEPFPIFQNYIALVRYHSNGTLDSSFNANGIVIENISGLEGNGLSDVLITKDGGILISGSGYESNWTGFTNMYVAKYISGVAVNVKNYDLLENDLIVYPNPSTHQIRLLSSTSKLFSGDIYDMLGQKVLAFKGKNEINVDHLSSGHYVLQARTDKLFKPIKFSVQR